jgi:16S rRNA C1402 (ribose-2'-O) methylase RsmI
MVLLALELTKIFNIYIVPTEVILKMIHHIDFKLGDLIIWVKKKSQEENKFKSLFNIVNKLNTNTKVSEKKKKEIKKLDEESKRRRRNGRI